MVRYQHKNPMVEENGRTVIRLHDNLSEDDVVRMLGERRGTWRLDEYVAEIARATKTEPMSAQYLHQMLNGHRRPSKEVLDYLGLEKVVVYRRKRTRMDGR